MRRVVPLLLCGLVLVAGCAKDQSAEVAGLKQEVNELKALTGPPPASLDAFYPPKSPAPAYQLKMFDLAAPFAGMIVKLNEGDRKAAKELFDAFRGQYTAVADMVPEWTSAYPAAPLDDLGALIEQAEPAKVLEAVGKVDAVCHACHVTHMAKVQYRYHWEDFSAISLSEPVTNRSLEFSEFMMSLELSVAGMGMELQGGSVEKARDHLGALRTKLETLKGACQVCHETERKYYVDAEVFALIEKLGTALKASPPDGKLAGELSQQIAAESCGKCHLVHIPATYAKARWKAAVPTAMPDPATR
jgi:hypothetical protein